MLDDVPGLISPIISAMVATKKSQQDADELAERTRQAKADEALRTSQLKQAQGIADTNAAHNRGLLEILQQKQALDADAEHLKSVHDIYDLLKGGVKPEDIQRLGLKLPLGNLPSGQDLNTSENARLFQQAQAQAGGAAAGQAPFQQQAANAQALREEQQKQADFGRTKELQQAGFSNTHAEDQLKLESEERRNAAELASRENMSKLERDTQMSIANMDNASRMQLGQMQYGYSPEEGQARAVQIFSGQTKPTNSPQDRHIVAAGVNQGMRLPGEDVDELKTLQALNPILDRFEDFSKNNLSTNKIGALIQKGTAATPLSTEDKNKYAEIMSDLQQVGKALEGYSGGRILSKQFESEAGGVPALGITSQQGLERVANLRKRAEERKQAIVKSLPPAQQEIINKVYGLNATPAGATVKLKAPDGTIKDIPIADANMYKAKGAVEVK